MITCILHGELAIKFGREYKFKSHNVRGVLAALKANFDDFQEYFQKAAEENIQYFILVDGYNISGDLELLDPIFKRIDIVPAIEGSGTTGKFLLGAALIVGSFFMPATFLGIGSAIWGAAGVSLAAGAIGEWISPTQEEKGNDTSYRLQDGGNRTYQGEPVPLAIGLDFVWIENPPAFYSVQNNTIPVGYDLTNG